MALTQEDKYELLQIAKDEYYIEFSKLIASTLKKVPKEWQDDLLVRLQETSSVYGSRYARYL